MGVISRADALKIAVYATAAQSKMKGYASHQQYSVVGQTPRIPKQKRNSPCGCGSGIKAKKCCGEYVK